MPAVFVHGVPETPAIWDDLRSHLSRDDVIALQLPGFGCPRPAGFGATKEEYVEWLVGELEPIAAQGPIDLVGHDWGGGFTVRLVSTRADLVRSWVTDAAGPRQRRLRVARLRQDLADARRGRGSSTRSTLAQSPDERARSVRGVVRRAARRGDRAQPPDRPDDGRLHPGAVPLGGDGRQGMGARLPRHRGARPRAHPHPTTRSSTPTCARASAKSTGASVTELDGLGHWWMLQDPARGAAAFEEFWATLD